MSRLKLKKNITLCALTLFEAIFITADTIVVSVLF